MISAAKLGIVTPLLTRGVVILWVLTQRIL